MREREGKEVERKGERRRRRPKRLIKRDDKSGGY